MRKSFYFAILALLAVLLAAPSFAQTVAYSGKLQIGFGDQDNTVATGQRTNNAIPICAGNPEANLTSTAPAGTTYAMGAAGPGQGFYYVFRQPGPLGGAGTACNDPGTTWSTGSVSESPTPGRDTVLP